MEYLVIIAFLLLIVIVLLAQDSKKETKKERYGDAIGNLATMISDNVKDSAFKLTESKQNKEIRLAKEALGKRNFNIYSISLWSSSYKTELREYLNVDDNFKEKLDLLGITPERWNILANHIYHIGVIRRSSRKYNSPKERIKKWEREILFSDKNDFNIDVKVRLTESLAHFNIPVDEWIKYGEIVLDMHEIYENKDMKEYGYLC